MLRDFYEYDQLLADLREMISRLSPRIIGVEGFMAAGKSYLAEHLAADLGGGVIETDALSIKLLYSGRMRLDRWVSIPP